MLLVVMLEGNCQVKQRRFLIRSACAHVVTLDGLHEALGHAVVMRATQLCGHWLTVEQTVESVQRCTPSSYRLAIAPA